MKSKLKEINDALDKAAEGFKILYPDSKLKEMTDALDKASEAYKNLFGDSEEQPPKAIEPPIKKNEQPNMKGLDYIKPDYRQSFISIENSLAKEMPGWPLIKRAAFCELLFSKKYFIKSATRRKTPKLFCSKRYGIDIKNQLEAAKKTGRATHKLLLKKYFD